MQNELERIDREWEMERRNYTSIDKNGRETAPGEADMVRALIVIVFGLIGIVGAASGQANGIAILIGILIVAFGIFMTIAAYNEVKVYTQRKNYYQQSRANLVSRIKQRIS